MLLIQMRGFTVLLYVFLAGCSGSKIDTIDASPPSDAAPPNDAAHDAEAGDASSDPRRLELGTGDTEFEPFGAEVELIMGPQGGWHVELAVRACNISPDNTLFVAQAQTVEGDARAPAVERTLTERRVLRDANGCWVHLGTLLIFGITSPDMVANHDSRVDVTVTEADGTITRESRVIHIVDRQP